MSSNPRGAPQTKSNLFHSLTYRRNSDGNYTTPTHIILRVPQLSLPMEVCQRTSRAVSLTGSSGFDRRDRTPSPFGEERQRTQSDNHSGCSSPVSSRCSSVNDCSELLAALEALTTELQAVEARNVETSIPGPAEDDFVKVTLDGIEEAPNDDKKNLRSLDLAEKERLLTECKNQIQSLSQGKQQLERRVEELQRELDVTAPFRVANKKVFADCLTHCHMRQFCCGFHQLVRALEKQATTTANKVVHGGNVVDEVHVGSAKRWPNLRINVDMKQGAAYDNSYVESTEIINAFVTSERHYLNTLGVLHRCYELPLRMLCTFKPDVISIQQLDSIFLNCSELLLLHRLLFEELSQLPSLPEAVQVDKLLELLERTFSAFSLYTSFMDNIRPQAVQRELKLLNSKPEFAQLLGHCQEKCDGMKLTELLQLPADRMTQYSDLLTCFLDPHVRGMPEDGSKRAETLIRFLRNLRYELLDDKSDWHHTLEKIKFIHKLSPDMPVPLEVFDSDVVLLKQGPLNQVLSSKKEVPRHCFLFNKFIAVAEKANDTQFRLLEHGMIPLSGAQLAKCVDVEGQAIGCDLQTGLSEDRLAFRLSPTSSESLFLRAAKPNVLKSWLEALDKSLQECQDSQNVPEENFGALYPEAGTKIAAASLEKLFQQLTSPAMFRDDFMEVFLMTHSCFTTPKEVLTALLNCVKSPDDTWSDTSSQGSSNAAFPFNMDELANDSEGGSSSPASTPGSHQAQQCSPGRVTHRTKLNPSSAVTRKNVHSGSSLVSTSDSDTSPHTSAIVVDHPPAPEGTTQNGWLDPEMGLKGFSYLQRAANENALPEADEEEDNHYTKLYPRCSQVHVVCDGSGEDSGGEEETDGGVTPRQSSLTGSLELGPAVKTSRQRASTDLGNRHDVNGSVLITKLEQMDHSKITQELENANKLMADMIGSLDTDFLSPSSCKESSLDKKGMARSRSGSMSSSQPDITIVEDESPPIPPRDLPTTPTHKLPLRTILRANSEHSLLTQSLSISRSEPSSPFHSTKPAGRSVSISEQSGKRGKAATMERSSPAKSKKQKKGGSMGDYYKRGNAHAINVTASLNVASLQVCDSNKSPKRSKWDGIRNKMTKKFKRSPSLEGEELQGMQGRYARKGSLGSDNLMTTGVNLPDGVVSRRQRRSSSSYNSVALVSKIVAVLNCWQEHFFEDFEEDLELKKMLCDFLSVLAKKSSCESIERQAASALLENVEQKSLEELATPPSTSFPVLLSRTINISYDVLMMYDWDHPDKLIPDKSIDLARIKDSQLLRVFAEQLTLMEFAVYAAIQRRELLNCSWKKPNKETLAPNVCRLIKRTNAMTSWVSTEILSQESPSQRASVIENFIRIATYCHQHNDMHCSLNITIALGSACIKSLKQTWEEVDKKYKRQLEKLRDWTDYHGRCKKMRERLERTTAEHLLKNDVLPQALPYVGAFLDQIYSLEMSSKTYNPNGLVNFAKMTKLSAIVRSALQYQEQHYTFDPRLDVMVYVTAAKRLSENDLFELSHTREPSQH